MRLVTAAAMGCILVIACVMAEQGPVAGEESLAQWAVDPGEPGRDIPAEGRSLFDYAAAVRQIGDTEVIEVTATSAALCASGFAPEKK